MLIQTTTDSNPLKSDDVVQQCMVQYQHLNDPNSALAACTSGTKSGGKKLKSKQITGKSAITVNGLAIWMMNAGRRKLTIKQVGVQKQTKQRTKTLRPTLCLHLYLHLRILTQMILTVNQSMPPLHPSYLITLPLASIIKKMPFMSFLPQMPTL